VRAEPGGYIRALRAFVARRGIELSYANEELGRAHGASLKGRILLRDDLSPAVEFSVLVHEVAHLCSVVGYVDSGDGVSSPRTPVHEPLVSLLQANHKWWNRFLTNPFDQSES
jgi:hypothetical protein